LGGASGGADLDAGIGHELGRHLSQIAVVEASEKFERRI